MKRLMIAGGAFAAAALLSSCTTMSKDECLAGAWGERGYADGASGYPMTRLDDHAKACAKFQIAPNPAAYGSAREDGLRTYCTFQRGWEEGRAMPIMASAGPRRSRRFYRPIVTAECCMRSRTRTKRRKAP